MTPVHHLPIFDADNHLYEMPDALLRHLPQRYKSAVRFVQDGRRSMIVIQNRMTDFMPNPTFEVVAAPGKFVPFYSANNPEGLTLREMAGDPIHPPPSFRDDPAARLALLDEQGVDAAMVYPTLANLVEEAIEGDPELTHAVIHALNQWLHETWTFNYQERIFVTPVLTLGIVEEAIKELEWVLEHGARVVLIRPAPPEGFRGHRSFALPEFDTFWARVEEARLPVCIHAAHSIVEGYVQLWEPPGATVSAFARSAFRILTLGHRDIQDALTSLICHGALTRFPNLRIASVENGTEWVPPLLASLERSYRQMPQAYAEHPVDVFVRNIYLTPFWEEHLREVVDLVGIDRVLFGSDFPHPEGLAEPRDYIDHLGGFDDVEVAKIMHDNAARFVGVGAHA